MPDNLGMETWKKCGHPRTPENTVPNTTGAGKPIDRCRTCKNASQKAARRANPAKHRAEVSAWQRANPQKHTIKVIRARHKKKLAGLGLLDAFKAWEAKLDQKVCRDA